MLQARNSSPPSPLHLQQKRKDPPVISLATHHTSASRGREEQWTASHSWELCAALLVNARGCAPCTEKAIPTEIIVRECLSSFKNKYYLFLSLLGFGSCSRASWKA